MLGYLLFGSQSQQPTKVLSVYQKDYDSRLVHIRGNGLLMYSPQNISGFFKNKAVFEIVLPLSITENMGSAFSLFRSDNEMEAAELFSVYNNVIPNFVLVEKKVAIASLQELCDILRENKSWNIAHVYAHLGRAKCFEEQCVQALMNEADDVTGMTPIMVAIASKNLAMVRSLISLGCSLSSLSADQNSVLHHAAIATKEIMNCLLEKTEAQKWINSFNGSGHTPLHIACISDKPDIVKTLLIAGADANVSTAYSTKQWRGAPLNVGNILKDNEAHFSSDDMKYGGTPLHWCFSTEVMETLLNASCDINAENLQGKTALFMMVNKNKLDCVVLLLCSGADSSKQDLDGNTVVHEAVIMNNLEILQALVVFGADVNIENAKGETPRHLLSKSSNINTMTYVLHVGGAKRCSSSKTSCTPSCGNGDTFDGIPNLCVPEGPVPTMIEHMMAAACMEKVARKKRPLKGGRLLCLDGGGVRGLILIQILLELEKELNKPIVESFDWISGTSTGGILALGLAHGMSLRKCQQIYFTLKEKVFNGERPYSANALESLLQNFFGSTTKMSDLHKARLIITAVEASQKPMHLHLFRNYPSPLKIVHNLQSHSGDVEMVKEDDELVWEVARKTSAAPTYFDNFKNYVDGALIANNPTLDALTEMMEYSVAQRAAQNIEETIQPSIVVSCGTGLIPSSQNPLNIKWKRSLVHMFMMALQLKEFGQLLVDLATCTDGRVVDRARTWCSMAGIPYYRLNPQMSEDVPLDEKSNLVLIKILWETKAYMFDKKAMIKEILDVLNQS